MSDRHADTEIALKQAAKLPSAKAAIARIRAVHEQHKANGETCHCEAEAALDVMLAAGRKGRAVR